MRRLVLLRHARARAARPGQADAERPLAGEGLAEATSATSWLLEQGVHPDLVLVSSALRTQQTWGVLEQRVRARAVSVEERLYETSVEALLHRLTHVSPAASAVLVVEHEPVVSRTALALAGDGSDGALVARVRVGVPTGGAVLLRVPVPWSALAGGAAVLEALHTPS